MMVQPASAVQNSEEVAPEIAMSNGAALKVSLVSVGVAGLLVLLSMWNYLFFHSLAEMFAILVAFGIFTVFWNTRSQQSNSFYVYIGITYLFVGVLDFLHLLAYPGMNILPYEGTNLAAQLWICARYLEMFSVLAAVWKHDSRLFNVPRVLGLNLVILAGVVVTIFIWPVFPLCFEVGAGLTPFKIVSEYVISFGLVLAAFLMHRRREEFESQTFNLLRWSLILSAAMEVSFTLYSHAYAPANMVGHLLKILSFFLMYLAFVRASIKNPFMILSSSLKDRETELQAAMTNLSRINTELEEIVQERTALIQEQKLHLQALVAELSEAEQQERRRIAQIIHDDLQQFLAALRLHTGSVRLAIDDPALKEKLTYNESLIDHAIEVARTLSNSIAPPFVRDAPMVEVLHWLSRQAKALYNLNVTVEGDGVADVNNLELKAFIYQVVRELLLNVVKHANTLNAVITIDQEPGTRETRITVSDQGKGFDLRQMGDESSSSSGFGLVSLQRRFDAINGRFDVQSTPGQGTKVTIRINPNLSFRRYYQGF